MFWQALLNACIAAPLKHIKPKSKNPSDSQERRHRLILRDGHDTHCYSYGNCQFREYDA